MPRLAARFKIEDVLKAPKWPASWPYTPQDFSRHDESLDVNFYEQPRLLYHIDDHAVKALTDYYSKAIPDNADVLDICSSWVSHFPKDKKLGKVTGLGMNELELEKNAQLADYTLKDLNLDPTFPYADNSYDVVTCVVSVDYLNKPLEVFKEIGRVLRPGGVAIMSQSNRCFPSKAIAIWLNTNDAEHVFIIGSYFHYSNLFNAPEGIDISPNSGRSDPMLIIKATAK
jgi:SAM-dependent methyltransferase